MASTSPPKVSKPIDSVAITGSRSGSVSWSGSYGAFQDYYSTVGGSGLTRATPVVVVSARKPPPPTTDLPPSVIVDDKPSIVTPVDNDFGSGDPSDWPPFEDPNDPFIPPKDPGTSEPPEDDSDLPEIVVQAAGEPTPVAPAMFPFAAAPVPAPAPKRPSRRPSRRKPAPKRRPLRTRPRPGRGPRVPIVEPVPEVPVVARRVLPILGVLTLVPWFMGVLGRVDRYGTNRMFDRMYGAPGTRKDDERANDRLGSRSPDKNPAGDPNAPGEPIDEVVVTGSRPSPFPAPPSLYGAPLADPGVDYYPPVNRFIRPTPTRAPRKRRGPSFAVTPDAPTGLEPFPSPAPLPPRANPRPRAPVSPPSSPPRATPVVPGAPLVPGPSAGPGPVGFLDPVPDIGPVPVEQLDRCNCPQKRKSKKREQRTVCSRGSYVQTASGLQKKPSAYFDCATGDPRPAPSRPKAAKPRGMKKPKGGWPTNLKDLLNPKP